MEYPVSIKRIIDGDTLEVDIDLGFSIKLVNQHLRLAGIDTPEIHSSDSVEKHYGNLARETLTQWVADKNALLLVGGGARDKFGRLLGDLKHTDGTKATDFLLSKHMAVKYDGQSKTSITEAHLANRKLLDPKEIKERKWQFSRCSHQSSHRITIIVIGRRSNLTVICMLFQMLVP